MTNLIKSLKFNIYFPFFRFYGKLQLLRDQCYANKIQHLDLLQTPTCSSLDLCKHQLARGTNPQALFRYPLDGSTNSLVCRLQPTLNKELMFHVYGNHFAKFELCVHQIGQLNWHLLYLTLYFVLLCNLHFSQPTQQYVLFSLCSETLFSVHCSQHHILNSRPL